MLARDVILHHTRLTQRWPFWAPLIDYLTSRLLFCFAKGIPVIFALSRKRLGLVYGSYRLVSAVAIMDVVDAGAEEEHNRVVELMMRGDSKRVRK